MNEKLKKYLDGIFSAYDDLTVVKEVKEELFNDLQEKLNDLKAEGYDENTAYNMAIHSIGEVSEIIESINAKTRELQQVVGRDFSITSLQNSDFTNVKVLKGKFNYSDLKGSDFSNSDFSGSSFKCSDLENTKFNGANLAGAKMPMSSLKGASFRGAILEHIDFYCADLSGVCFDNCNLSGMVFHYTELKEATFRNAVLKDVTFKTDVKKAIFDGATMDKLTYAILKGKNANLTNVTVI